MDVTNLQFYVNNYYQHLYGGSRRAVVGRHVLQRWNKLNTVDSSNYLFKLQRKKYQMLLIGERTRRLRIVGHVIWERIIALRKNGCGGTYALERVVQQMTGLGLCKVYTVNSFST